jgi:hypothetical protein
MTKANFAPPPPRSVPAADSDAAAPAEHLPFAATFSEDANDGSASPDNESGGGTGSTHGTGSGG